MLEPTLIWIMLSGKAAMLINVHTTNVKTIMQIRSMVTTLHCHCYAIQVQSMKNLRSTNHALSGFTYKMFTEWLQNGTRGPGIQVLMAMSGMYKVKTESFQYLFGYMDTAPHKFQHLRAITVTQVLTHPNWCFILMTPTRVTQFTEKIFCLGIIYLVQTFQAFKKHNILP